MIEDRSEDVALSIHTYLSGRFPALADLGPDTSLLRSGAVDSLGVLDLMLFLVEKFGIALEDEDFAPGNIETPARLAAFVRDRLAG